MACDVCKEINKHHEDLLAEIEALHMQREKIVDLFDKWKLSVLWEIGQLERTRNELARL